MVYAEFIILNIGSNPYRPLVKIFTRFTTDNMLYNLSESKRGLNGLEGNRLCLLIYPNDCYEIVCHYRYNINNITRIT